MHSKDQTSRWETGASNSRRTWKGDNFFNVQVTELRSLGLILLSLLFGSLRAKPHKSQTKGTLQGEITEGSGVEPQEWRGHLSGAEAPSGGSMNLRLCSAPLRLCSASARLLGLGSLRLPSASARLLGLGSLRLPSAYVRLSLGSLRLPSAYARPGFGSLRLRSAAAPEGRPWSPGCRLGPRLWRRCWSMSGSWCWNCWTRTGWSCVPAGSARTGSSTTSSGCTATRRAWCWCSTRSRPRRCDRRRGGEGTPRAWGPPARLQARARMRGL